MVSPFRRALPARVGLEQQKFQAKELLTAFVATDATVHERVRAVLPDKPAIVLGDALLVLSREYGFDSWSALGRHIGERITSARAPHDQMDSTMLRSDDRWCDCCSCSMPSFGR